MSKRAIRWPALAGVTALVLGCLVSSGGAEAASSSTWGQPGSDAGHSNRNVGETTITSSTVGWLTPQYAVAGILPSFGFCSPDSTAFAADATTLFGYDGRRLVATTLATGAQKWRSADILRADDGTTFITVALAGSLVLVSGEDGCGSESEPDGFIAAYAKSGGGLKWRVEDDGVRDLLVSGTTAVAATFTPQSTGPHLFAVNTTSGARLWDRYDCTAEGVQQRSNDADVMFASGDDLIASCGYDEDTGSFTAPISVLSLTTGATKWTKPDDWQMWRADAPNATAPAIYATDPTGKLTALNQNGTVKWASPTEHGPLTAAGATRLFVSCDGGSLCALDRNTGGRLWKVATSPNVVLASDVVYPIGGSTPLYAATGAPIYTKFVDYGGDWPNPLTARTVAVAGARVVVETTQLTIWQVGPTR